MKVNIGIFAHNEERSIRRTLSDLTRQDVFKRGEFEISVHILANGCTDETISICNEFAENIGSCFDIKVYDIKESGKSRTWNTFVHDISDQECEFLIFQDADISLPSESVISSLIVHLVNNENLTACPSRPVKDLALTSGKISLKDRLILASSGMLDDWKQAIAGSLYIVRRESISNVFMPIGLPVEDGYIHAIIQTEAFKNEGANETKINAPDNVYHVFDSERHVTRIIRHQARLVIGSSINFLIFDFIREYTRTYGDFKFEIFKDDELFVKNLIRDRLPNLKFGYIPYHFLFKRLVRFNRGGNRTNLKGCFLLFVGLGFDCVVYFYAQYLMARGRGQNFW
ncbi:glycosyltransferase family 2 protein [Microcoleus sp. Pol14D5]